MKQKYKKYFLLLIIAPLLICSFIIYSVWNKPHKDVLNAAAVKTDAITLYQNLSRDSIRAKALYLNKVVEVSGTIKLITSNLKKEQVVLLQTRDEYGSVNCTMEQNLLGLRPGNKALIKGICLGYGGGDTTLQLPGDVFMVRCYPKE